jgi:branched-chain amino acid transport system permease protein
MTDQAAASVLPLPAAPSTAQRMGQWLWVNIARPLLQILVFIVIGVVIMTVAAYAIALLSNAFKLAKNDLDMVRIVNIQLADMVIGGVATGFLYAVIALGYTMVYGVLRFINFAHSEIFMVGGVMGYEVFNFMAGVAKIKDADFFGVVFLILLSIGVAALVCGALAVGIERVAYRPLRNAPKLVSLVAAIGVSLLLQDIVRALAGLIHNSFKLSYSPVTAISRNYPIFPPAWKSFLPENLAGATIAGSAIAVIVGGLIMMLGLNYFVNSTRLGKGIRAVSMDRPTAALMGINVNAIIALTFFIGGALGGAAGVLYGMRTSVVDAYVGFLPGLKAFTAAVLGGIGSITGALLGGILLGLIESFLSGLLPYYEALGTGYRDIFAFIVLIAILIFRPTGLLGERVDEKV